jgi:predicted SAM-dependent methyltransferase
MKLYNQHVKWRGECGQKFGAIRDLPVVSPHAIASELISRKGGYVLDFGCGVHKVNKDGYRIPDEHYFSLDTDPDGDFDYNSLDDIPGNKQFDFVIMNQVIEHIPFDDCMKMMTHLSEFVNGGGYIFITVPNMQHPVRYWGDLDHVTTWTFEDIYGLFKNTGFEVEQLGRYNKQGLPFNPIKRFIIKIVCDVFRVDWCDSIMGLGKKL